MGHTQKPTLIRLLKRNLVRACLLPAFLHALSRSSGHGKLLAHVFTTLKTADLSLEEKEDIVGIEQERARLLNVEELLPRGFGNKILSGANITVKQACRASVPFKKALMLYVLIRTLKPENVLKLGSNLGISSSYLAMALRRNSKGRLTTLEGSPCRLAVAKEVHRRLALQNISYVEGVFEKTLDPALQHMAPVDFVFIDGDHHYQPTLNYFDQIISHAAPGAVFVFDDIRWSHGMKQAWFKLRADKRLALALDLYPIGIGVKASISPGRRHCFSNLWAFFEYAVDMDFADGVLISNPHAVQGPARAIP